MYATNLRETRISTLTLPRW